MLTTLDYAHLLDVHRVSGNALTIATHRRVVQTDYGVLHTNGTVGETSAVTGFEEKPAISYTVSMGVYIAEPTVLDYVDADTYLDVPDLVLRLLSNREQVGGFLYDGYWLDIGRHEDVASFPSHPSTPPRGVGSGHGSEEAVP